jgi:hypothetical protein
MSLSTPSTSAAGTRPKGKILHSQECAMVFKVYFFNELSSEEVRAKTEFSKCQEITARACNVSVITVATILKQGKLSTTEIGVPIFKSPDKHHKKQKTSMILLLIHRNVSYIICILEISCLL